MHLLTLLQFITTHPLNRKRKLGAILRFLRWQINSRLNPYPVVYPFSEKAFLIIQKGMTGATQNLYCGLHEFYDMGFLLHVLREGDLFVDIGANIGSYTILASAHAGASTIAIEPVPTTFVHLHRNVNVNCITGKVDLKNIALGDERGTITFTASYDTTNHVAVAEDEGLIEVQMEKLDDLLVGKAPVLIKIDVEGFETSVLNGAARALEKSDLKAIIIELNGSGSRYGFDEKDIHSKLLNLNFAPYSYDPFSRNLTRMKTFGDHNTIYIRDFDFINDRVRTAAKINMLGSQF